MSHLKVPVLEKSDAQSDSEELSDSSSDTEISTNKIETDPIKIFDTKELYFYKMIDRFYRNCEKAKIDQMIKIIDGTSHMSLRVLDWVVTRYSKKNVDYDIKNKLTGEVFDIHISYKSQLKSFKKRYFDPFRRRKKFYYNYDKTDTSKIFYTTLGQLNFFRWAISNGIIEFVEKNLETILVSMNVSNKEDKKKKEKKDKKKQLIQKNNDLASNKEETVTDTPLDNKSVGSNKKTQKEKAKIVVKGKTKTDINIEATQNINEDEAEIVLTFN